MRFPLSLLTGSLMQGVGFDVPAANAIIGSSSPATVVASIRQGMPLRVLSLGDSITLGYNDPTGNSYRRDLQCQLWTGGKPVAMIGSVQHGNWDNNYLDAWPLDEDDDY